MVWHLIEGESGCAFAREHECVAVVVDVLRASTTAAMILDARATEIRAVRSVDEALALKAAKPDAVLFGERGGLPPEGFDFGNSPRDLPALSGKSVIFTTTTGTARVLDAQGAPAVYMGAPVNAMAVARAALSHDADVVLIPAGRYDDPSFDAHEDWVGAASIANLVDVTIGEGSAQYRETRHLIELDGTAGRLAAAPHAKLLRELGLGDDVTFCARLNLTSVVPRVVGVEDGVAILRSDGAPVRPED